MALVLPQNHQWTPRLIVTLVKLQSLLLDCLQKFGITQVNYPHKVGWIWCLCLHQQHVDPVNFEGEEN